MTAPSTQQSEMNVCALETHFGAPQADRLSEFSKFLSELIMLCAKCDGFWSGELHAPNSRYAHWTLIQRFESIAQAQDWNASPIRTSLLEQLPARLGQTIDVRDELKDDTLTEVTAAIVTHVKPEMEKDFFEWEAKIIAAQAMRSGYRSLRLQTPPKSQPQQWTSMVKFDSPGSLDAWFASSERRELMSAAEKLVKKSEIRAVPGVFPGWVPLDEKGQPPRIWKTALLVLLGLFPVVVLEQIFVMPWLQALHPVVRTFIGLVGSVAATSFITMPYFVASFKWWLFPKKSDSAASIKGLLIMIVFFAAEIWLFVQFGGFKH